MIKILELLTPKKIIGNIGEKKAVAFLRKQHYKILKLNFIASGHEIDVVALTPDKTTLAFIEVKTRTVGKQFHLEPRPACAVFAEKQRGIIRAARIFKYSYPDFLKMRFDIIEVYLSDEEKPKAIEIKHLIGAFNRQTAFRPYS